MSPYLDVGGTHSELIITFKAGNNKIVKGDPLRLSDWYTVDNSPGNLFGQAMRDADPGETLPVLVRGVAVFEALEMNWSLMDYPRIGRDKILIPDFNNKNKQILNYKGNKLWVLL